MSGFRNRCPLGGLSLAQQMKNMLPGSVSVVESLCPTPGAGVFSRAAYDRANGGAGETDGRSVGWVIALTAYHELILGAAYPENQI